MQLIPDVVQEANMSDKQITAMESTSSDAVEASMADSLESTNNEDLLDGNTKDVMVAIPGHYLNKEIKDLKEISALTKDLLSGIHGTENDNGTNDSEKTVDDTQETHDNANKSQVENDNKDDIEHTETTTEDQVDSPKLFNGAVKLEPQTDPSEDVDMPATPLDTESETEKLQNVPNDSSTKNVQGLNGVIEPIKVEPTEEIDTIDIPNDPIGPVALKTEMPKTPESLIDSNDTSESCKPKETVEIKKENDVSEHRTSNINKSAEMGTAENSENFAVDTPVDINNINEEVKKSVTGDILKPNSGDPKNADSDNDEMKKSEEVPRSDIEQPTAVIIAENKPVEIFKPDPVEATKTADVPEKLSSLDAANNKSVVQDPLEINEPAIVDTLNLDSDDEMDGKKVVEAKSPALKTTAESKECISVDLDDDDDDDIMLVDDLPKETAAAVEPKENIDESKSDALTPTPSLNNDHPKASTPIIANDNDDNRKSPEKVNVNNDDIVMVNDDKAVSDNIADNLKEAVDTAKSDKIAPAETADFLKPKSPLPEANKNQEKTPTDDETKSPKEIIDVVDEKEIEKKLGFPLVPLNFKINLEENLADLTRKDLEEFCLVKVVEAIVARSNLSDVQLKLKMLQKNIEEWRKKLIDVTKQNKDLDTVVRAVNDLQKRNNEERPVPIKITRSVGLQVGFTCHPSLSKVIDTPKPPTTSATMNVKKGRPPRIAPKPSIPNPPIPNSAMPNSPSIPSPPTRTTVTQPYQKKKITPTTPIPVPRIVAANKSPAKSVDKNSPSSILSPAVNSNMPTLKNALQNSVPDNRKPAAEKRPATFQSIDLTSDEPPAKQPDMRTLQAKLNNPPTIRPPNRTENVPKIVQPVNRIGFIGNSRPVFFQQHQNNIGGNTTIISQRKIAPAGMNRPHTLVRVPGSNQQVRMTNSIPIMTAPPMRHPAPLPQTPLSNKQVSHPSWKWIPPRPSLKISKADNGIVISWEMEGFVDSRHEEVASYQIYAYQETTTPPNTDLWKKIGDVKSLPLPMACTLTKFMAGFKYYFAVRAVDVRSRVGPFSAPGQILLVNEK